jgi:ADP-dependent NAD(P)H-hydrate dehydratase / NAD(P)H-hydrate epimerase
VLPVLTREEMRAADAAALSIVSEDTLVARAGTAVGHAALKILGGGYGRRVIAVVGKGNNGADGRVAAAFLARRGARVTLVEAAEAPAALAGSGPAGLVPDLIIDAAYGTGFRGAYDAPEVPPGVPVLSIDIPSGVDADTGAAPGQAFTAAHTVTFAAYKPGLLQGAGGRLSGHVHLVDIGISLPEAQAALIEDADVPAHLPARPRQSNKWTTALGVACGSVGMEGSAILCTRGAMAAGAGMIRLGTPGSPVAPWPTEAVRVHLDAKGWADPFLEATTKCQAMVVGPGLGTDDATGQQIRAVIARAPHPLVVDADGITALGDLTAARELIAGRDYPTILTPHDGEYARLSGSPPGDDRLAAARRLARDTGAIVLLKGPLTAVAAPNQSASDQTSPDVYLAAAGVPGLATAGTGDVLSGVIGAFLARGVPAHLAAALAAHVHGRAASRGRPEGLVAGDLPDLLAAFLSEVNDGNGRPGRPGGRRSRG